jgi:HTH-type transcriptional regulator / antitoxin HigA
MKTIKKKGVADSYLGMIRLFPLRPIRNDAECKEATNILDQYFPRADMDAGTADYIHTLAILVDEFDREHHPFARPKFTPAERLKYLMDENGMSTADLGRLLGNSGLASLILHGKRAISKANAKVLAKRFGLEVGTFI